MPRRDASRDGIGHFDSVFLVRTSQVPDEIFDDVGFIEFFDLNRGVPGAQREQGIVVAAIRINQKVSSSVRRLMLHET